MIHAIVTLLWLTLPCYGFVLLSSAASTTRQYEAGVRYNYVYETTVLINEAGLSGKDVGFRITALLGVSVVWQSPVQPSEKLLYFDVTSPQLHIKSRKAPSPEGFVGHSSKLDGMVNSPFLIHWKDGIVQNIYLQDNDEISLSNFKRGIASLFQIRTTDGKSEETDASGHCSVAYKTDNGENFEKSKSKCISEKTFINNPDNVTGVEISSLREFKFSHVHSSTIVKDVSTYEVHHMKARLIQEIAGKVTSKQEIKLTGTTDGTVNLLKSEEIANAVMELEKAHQTIFNKTSLAIIGENPTCQDECPSLFKLVSDNRKHLETENIGTTRSAGTFIKLLHVARQSTADQILKVLQSPKNKRILPQLIDLIGATQTTQAHEAAMKSFHFDSDDDADLVERYLWALSVGSNPQSGVIQDLLKRSMKKNGK